MSKKTFTLFVFLVLALLAACATPTPAPTAVPSPPTAVVVPLATVTPTPAGPLTVTILHTNDMHGFFEGEILKGSGSEPFEFGGIVNAMGTLVRLKPEANHRTIILDDGDFWQGTFASNRDEGKAIIAAMNSVGYDALTLGNHDFDHGVQVVKARAGEAKFPFLAANLIEQATGKPPAWVKPYIIKEVAGIRFGLIGLTNSGTPAISSKASELKVFKFVNEVESLKQWLPEVKGKSDLIIVLSHNGLDREEQLARDVPGVDVVISGHTHVVQNQSKLVGNAIVVHAGYKAQFVGRLELKIDPATKKIVDYTRAGEAVAAVSNKATPPKEVVDLIGKLMADAREAINRPIGETLIDLDRVYTADGRSTGEYPLGNIVVDAMLAANQAGDRPADIAIHNNAGIRADLPKGPITYGKLYEVLPFDNVLAAMDLTGAQIKAVLEVAASCPRVNTLVAGMSFVYDCSKPPGNRISKIMIQGKAMEPQKVYRVQTIDYLAGGGDGQVAFKEGANLAYGDPTVDVVAEYIRKNSPLNPKVEGRIVEASSK